MIYQKRGHWCFRDDNGKLHKFATEAAAKAVYGVDNGSKEEELFEEEASSDEQEVVFDSESGSEEEV